MGIPRWPPPDSWVEWPVPGQDGLKLLRDDVTGKERKGGQGIVFKAEKDGETLAVKFLKESVSASDVIEAFRREAWVGIQHDSPYLGRSYQLLDLRPYQGCGWPPFGIVMEFFQLSLEDLLSDCLKKRFKLPFHLVEVWTRQLAEACQDLHERHYIHCDIKPSNIMFRWPRGRFYGKPDSLKLATAVLTDLGVIAEEGEGPRVLGDHWKDHRYFRAGKDSPAPECPLKTAADIYSLGKVFDAIVPHVDGPTEWLARIAAKCQADDVRPSAFELRPQLSANADRHIADAKRAGWRPGKHAEFVGRTWVQQERDQFIEQSVENQHGGIFLVVGPAGVGKSAILTNWASAGAPWPGYYFDCRETGAATSMPDALYRQIKGQLSSDYEPPKREWETKDVQAMLDDWSANNQEGRLLIFIDALDEAKAVGDENISKEKRTGPRLAAELIPKDPPRGVFLIVSSRPATTEEDHLGKLRCQHLKRLDLLPEHKKNKEDVTLYFKTWLEDYLDDPNQAEQLMEAAGGIFRLAVLMGNEIRAGKETVAGVLQRALTGWGHLPAGKKLFGYYQDDLQRALGDPVDPYFSDFARLVVALQDWISEDEILRVLCYGAPPGLVWDAGRRDRLVRSLRWFLKREGQRRDGDDTVICYWPQHESVRDFLKEGTDDDPAPARTGVLEMHSRIGRSFHQLAQEAGWDAVPYYGRLYSARHLLQSGNKDDYRTAVVDLLCNPAYLQATLGDEPLDDAGFAGAAT